jgi:hypothetical protein
MNPKYSPALSANNSEPTDAELKERKREEERKRIIREYQEKQLADYQAALQLMNCRF